jgi:hypothetical protein
MPSIKLLIYKKNSNDPIRNIFQQFSEYFFQIYMLNNNIVWDIFIYPSIYFFSKISIIFSTGKSFLFFCILLSARICKCNQFTVFRGYM